MHIKAHVDGQPISQVLIDGGATINLMLWLTIVKIGAIAKDLMPSDIAMTDFNGKMSSLKRMVLVNLMVGSNSHQTLFVVMPSKSNYNLLLGQN